MAFFDKLGELAKSATDKTGDLIEISKIKTKMATEARTVAEEKSKLGAYFYDKYANGMQMEQDAADICAAIRAAEDRIAVMQSEIESINAENTKAAPEKPDACPGCGAQVADGLKFCPYCGAKLEAPVAPAAPAAPATPYCSACGAEVKPGVQFCSSCGAKIG